MTQIGPVLVIYVIMKKWVAKLISDSPLIDFFFGFLKEFNLLVFIFNGKFMFFSLHYK